MNEVIITSFFTDNGAPATNISGGYPLIHIWQVNAGTGVDVYLGSFLMTQVTDSAADVDGFYKYTFTSTAGFNTTDTYLFRTDGGPTLSAGERYQSGQLDPSDVSSNVANEVWNAVSSSYLTTGTTGAILAQTNANTQAIANNLFLNANSVLDLCQLILAYDTNRTKIDPNANTLTVYESDCVTPLRVFQLLDTTGAPSITEVAERKPVSANDGQPVCP
jgi:hypothetical protein